MKIAINATEIKNILAKKFADEECGFTESDIKVSRTPSAIWITINDYDHITFKMWIEDDDYFGHIVYIDEYWYNNETPEFSDSVAFVDSKTEFDYRTALVRLGYHIANTF